MSISKSSAARSAAKAEYDDNSTERESVARQITRVIPAKGAPRPVTTGVASVFAAAQAARPKIHRSLINPDSVPIRLDVPIPSSGHTRHKGSHYARLWARMPVGGHVVLTYRQGFSFLKWANGAGLRGQLVRRTLPDGTVGLWRVAPVQGTQSEPVQAMPAGLR